jgi:hypothetical protein
MKPPAPQTNARFFIANPEAGAADRTRLRDLIPVGIIRRW